MARGGWWIVWAVVALPALSGATPAADSLDRVAKAAAGSQADGPRFRIPTAPPEEPLPAAQRHIRKAREYLRASCEMLTCGSRFAVDGYYTACQRFGRIF